MFADQDWNLHLRDQHVNDKYFKDQHIWHLAPWPCRQSAGNPTGSAGRLRKNGERLGIWGGLTLILADFFWFWAQTCGELKGKRGLSIQNFLVSCVFLWRIMVFWEVFSQLRYLMYQPNEGWGWNRSVSGGHSGRFWAKHVRWVCPHRTPKKSH